MPQEILTDKDQPQYVAEPASEPFLPFTRPSIVPGDIEEVVRVLESGWITSGSRVRQLESGIAALTGCEEAVAVCSATAGMHLVLHALGIGPGDEVITPSLTWVSTVNLIELSGAKPVFVDVDRETLMTDGNLVERAISPNTRLIIPVHYAGAPFDIDPLRAVAAKHSIPVVEDAAHALGTDYKSSPVGKRGTAIFSFQAIKNVTSAEGGMICTDDSALAERLRRLRFHGLGADAFDRQSQGRLPSAEVLEPGYKYNLPDMNAALALGQLQRLPMLNARRAELAQMYLDEFVESGPLRPLGIPAYPHSHSWHIFVVRVDIDSLQITRDEFMEALKERQIGSGLHFRPAHTHKYYRERMPAGYPGLENTEWNGARLVTLPLFPGMRDADVTRVISAVNEIVDGNAK